MSIVKVSIDSGLNELYGGIARWQSENYDCCMERPVLIMNRPTIYKLLGVSFAERECITMPPKDIPPMFVGCRIFPDNSKSDNQIEIR